MGKCMKQQFNLGLSLALAALVAVVGVTHPEPVLGQVAARPAEVVEVPPATLDTATVGEAEAARRLGRVARAAHALRIADAANAPRGELLTLADELGQAVVALGPIEYLFGAPGAEKREQLDDMPYEMRSLYGDGEREIVSRMVAFRERANALHGARIGNQPEAMLAAARSLAESIKDQEFNGRFKPLDPDSVRRVVTGKIERAPAMTRNALDRVAVAPETTSAKTASAETTAAGIQAASDGDVGTRALSSNPAEVTPRIQALADQLGRSPIRIQNWVHDNIRFTPTYGVLRGAEQTLIARQGNAFDTNVLLAALLDASGYSTRYVYGTVQVPIAQMQNWLGNARTGDDALDLMLMGGIPAQYLTSGGRISAIRFEHLWLEAHVDFIPSRGVIERTPDTWVPLDGSFKQHTFGAPMSLLQATGWNPATELQRVVDNAVRGTDGSITGLDLNDYSTSLDAYLDRAVAHIDANAPDAKVDDVFGAQAIIPLGDEVLAGTLPYRVIARGTPQDVLPSRLMNHLVVNRFDTRTDYALESPSMTVRVPTHALRGHSIYVGYEAATQAQRDTLLDYASRNLASLSLSAFSVRPVLRVGDEIVGTGAYASMGTMQMWTAGIVDPHGRGSFGAEPHEYAAGSHISFTPNLGGVTQELVSELVEPLPDTVRLPMAQGLHLAGMQYWFMSDMQGDLSAKGWGGSFLRRPSVGAFAMPLQVTYFFGLPRTGFFTGQSTDIKSDNIAVANSDPAKRRMMIVQFGAQASFNESLTWDLLLSGQPGYGMSATSMLLRANELHVPIHIITRDNVSAIMPKLQLTADARAEIAQGVAAGLVAIVPEREYKDSRQVGAGYVILDPDSGAGLYRIDGGLNGAITIGCIAKAVSLELLCRSKMMKILARRIARWGARMLAGLTVAAVLGPVALPAIAVVSAVLWTIEIIMTAMEVMNWVRMVMNGIENLTPEELAELGINALDAAICNYNPPCFGGGGGGGGGRGGFGGGFGGGRPGRGNPVSVDAGVKYQTETDYIGAGAFPLVFERNYRSYLPNGSVLGHKWTNRYLSRVRLAPDADPTERPEAVLVARGDGALFQYVYRNGVYVAPADVPERIERQTDLLGRTTGWVYVNIDDETETYDDEGKLVRIRNRAGVEQVLAYNDADQLVRVTDDAGRSLLFEYDPVTTQLVRMTDPLDRVYTYEYSEYGSLVKVDYPGDLSREYHYEMPGRGSLLTGITDERGVRYATWRYDYQNRAIESTYAGGANRYTFSFGDKRTVVTDPYGASSTFLFRQIQDTNYATSSSQPCSSCGAGSVSTTEYNGNGDPSWERDHNGNLTTYSYNGRRLLSQVTQASGTPEAQTRSATWHPTWRLPTRINEPAASSGSMITDYTYNAQGLVETKTVTADGQSRVWRYTYNTRGQVLTEDGPRTDVVDITRYTYDDAGNLATVTDPSNLVTRYTQYDGAGKLLTRIDPNGTTTLYGYDDRDRLRTVTSVPAGQSTGETTVYLYDGAGNLTRMQLPDGSALTYGYDDAGRLTRISDSLGNRIVYTLNAAGDRVKEESFDPQDRLAQTMSRTINQLGRLTELKGADADDVTVFGHDTHGNETSVQSPVHAQAARSEYDPLHRLKASIDPLEGRVGYRYDAQDNLREVTDPRGLKTGYTFNGFNELLSLASPDTGNAQYRYDASGNLLQRTDSRNVVANYSYDAANRLIRIAYPDETLDYAYDELAGGAGAKGRLTTMSDGSGRTRYAYDAHGRVAAKVQQLGADDNAAARKTVGMAYANGLPSAMQLPSGAIVAYRYASDGRIRELLVNGQVIVSEVDHFLFDDPSGWTTPAGRYQRSFDLDGRVTGYTRGSQAVALQYDAAGRITAQTGWDYGYDDLDRLTSAEGARTLGWTYDATGNRTRQTDDASSSDYVIEATSNRLASVDGSARQYDNAGNTTSADGKTFVYNGRNRMSEVRQGASVLARYAYNAIGERVCVALQGGACPTASSTGNNYRQYVYDDDGHLLGEYDSAGNLIAEHVWLGDTPVAVLTPSSTAATHGGQVAGDVAVYFVHPDHLDTPRTIVNAGNVAIWTWDSAPFGDTPANQNPGGQGVFAYNLRFPGQQYDAASGLHYNYFRDYEAGAGRYVESDPIGLDGGLGTYLYVENAPLDAFDPEGLAKKRPTLPDGEGAIDGNCSIRELLYPTRPRQGTLTRIGKPIKCQKCGEAFGDGRSPTLGHNPTLVSYHNSTGYNSTQAERNDAYNDLIDGWECDPCQKGQGGSTKERYRRDTGPRFGPRRRR
jgi:RHS repeat-associated protein